jgi:hypothetical protein
VVKTIFGKGKNRYVATECNNQRYWVSYDRGTKYATKAMPGTAIHNVHNLFEKSVRTVVAIFLITPHFKKQAPPTTLPINKSPHIRSNIS